MKIIAFVPIKLNSKRIPGKNLLPIMEKPMCYHIFKTLLQSKHINEIFVYCSDRSILNHIPKGVKFLKRPKRLDGDKIKGMEIYQEFIKDVHADIYVLAHATSPFLKINSIDQGINKIITGEYDSAFSAKRIQTFCWYDGKPLNYDMNDIPRTQDIKPILVETSGFFAFTKNVIMGGKRIGELPWIQLVDNIEAIDIDEKEDYKLASKIS